MKIEWNKVTWYSKLIAVIVFVLTFYVGFYLGKETTKINNIDKVSEVLVSSVKYENLSKDGKYCFSRSQVATKTEPFSVTEEIILNIKGDLVTGTKKGNQTGPGVSNGYWGDLNGNIKENEITLIYSFTVEGSKGKELELYELSIDSLLQKHWPLEEKDKVLVPVKTGDPKIISYSKEECK